MWTMSNENEGKALATIGINEKHNDLKNEFIRRMLSFLNETEIALKSYQMSEDYCGNAQETVRLENESLTINLQLTMKK